ncbi:aminopeptidase N [Hyla sarda]|uniref:aminopeptidase N n=1 Tax=Hyla sarda TaxID=327740 RepID=UPI0024C35C5A|nr:aminopeptidase N [Hyla sarda]XP_056427951.1 aminopeptidase N [Hyla sarda]XP_056427952.1 aminopeptidase N [Hyla sarda]
MGKGFYVSKLVAFVAIFFAIAAVATIIALAVVYANEKSSNDKAENGGTTSTTTTTTTASSSSRTTSSVNPATTAPASKEPWDNYRLPNQLTPQHYDVDLRPILTKNNEGLYIFHGESKAYFTCNVATDTVIIHSKKLNYTVDPVLTDADNNNIPIMHFFKVEKTDYLVLHLNANLLPLKKYILHTIYTGELADDLAGFYRSEYVEDGVTKIIATTQMQAPDARKAFPCFDEPALKATFNITLRHKPNYVALSNMNVLSVSTEQWGSEAWNITVFEKSPKMSTYLVAFIVSEFASVGDERVKIWGRKKAIVDEKQGDYALNVTRQILEFFEEYYGAPYPLPKSDQVALPDFSAGAMENWGLVTYRETALLYDPFESSIGNKERVLTVIAHELAHQWFGNLVTIRWWNDLWLNEGFASYVEYLGADKAEDTWNIKDLAVLYDIHRVMAVDALASSHPLTSKEEEVNTPSEISSLFDSISYSKGASVIRMLSSFLTEELFVKGLQAYLKEFEYENTVYNNLWDSLQEAYDNETNRVYLPDSIERIMNTWVLQMGFPVVTINTADGSLRQKHFLLDPNSTVTRPSEFNYTWHVPISFLTSTNKVGNIWLTKESDTNNSLQVTGNEWLLANIDVTGYYRVNYDDGNWNRLLQQLNDNPIVIPVINRAQIVDDAFNLARAQIIDNTRALETTKFLSKDVEYMPWQAAISSLSYFTQMFDRSDVYGPMKAYMKQQVTPLFEYFKNKTNNWTVRPTTLTEQYNEINAVSLACTYGIPECGQMAIDLFNDWRTTKLNKIHANLRSTIYCNAIAQGGEEEWNFAWEQLNATTNAQEADKLRAALACSKEPWILNRLLEYALTSNGIRKQDAQSTITNVANNVVGQSLAWDFVRANWVKLLNDFGAGMSFGNLISGISRRFNLDFDLQQLNEFKRINTDNNVGFGTGARALEQAIEKTQANIIWVNQNKAAIKAWFESAVIP